MERQTKSQFIYRGWEITTEDSGYADKPHRFLAHQNSEDPVRHWGATVEEVKASIDREIDELHEDGKDCGVEGCQHCCPHSDARDHGICIDCGHEEDHGAAIDRAMDYGEDR